jgi:hypothetical protein
MTAAMDLTDDLFEPNLVDPDLLCAAVRRGDLSQCRTLIAQGARVNAKGGGNTGRTPLYLAVKHGRVEICRLLIDNGADVRRVMIGGVTALRLAVVTPLLTVPEILRMLMTATRQSPGVDDCWDPVRKTYLTAFQYAVARGVYQSVELLMDEFGEDPAQTTMDGVAMVDLTTTPAVQELLLAAITERSASLASGEPTSDSRPSTASPEAPQPRSLSSTLGAL